MARFITRVELLSAESDDYETLHAEMAKKYFKRTIKSVDNIEYHLPDAEYYREGKYTRSETLNAAKSAAEVTNKKYRVLVTQSFGISWYNLKKV